MNCFIIHTLRKRSSVLTKMMSRIEGQGQSEGQSRKIKNSEDQGQSEGQSRRMRNSERQIYIMLLLVTFGFLTLTTPAWAMVCYINFVNF